MATPPQPTPISFTPYFGGFILETLTVGMYGEARNAIREYIQNGFDSIQRARESRVLAANAGTITITMAADKKSLTIRDDGTGLPAKSAIATLTRVGASSKNHARNAGFRGIGRLAGIVFCDKLTFVTKAKGERQQTTVVFDAKGMRKAMSPAKGSSASAGDLMSAHVRPYQRAHPTKDAHFFEVRIEGLRDAPTECTSLKAMRDFVSQVAPVPYPDDFPYREELVAAARANDIPIEEVKVTVTGGGKSVDVRKLYGASYEFEEGEIKLTGCDIRPSPTGRWWAWIGKKEESGAYKDERVRGLRVRVRNIQIDGAELFRDIFRDVAKSQIRFQDYFLGEIFVKPTALVPNARRDGFEEDPAWRSVRKELGAVAKSLGSEAYAVSTAGQLSLGAQREGLKKMREDFRKLKKAKFNNVDRTVALTRAISTKQRKVAKASEAADLATSAALAAIGTEYADMKLEALRHVGEAAAELDREKVETDAREMLMTEVMAILEEQLSPECLAEVRDLLADYLDY
jgi:Histidine kinase-, DNA gyrase B-, and HSP90-like ATPase